MLLYNTAYCRVSLIKNGEEVVSVGGAVDKSMKNVGTSASNSVILNLEKVFVQTNNIKSLKPTTLLKQ